MSTPPVPAVDALRAYELVGDLTDIISRMRTDDVARFGPRSLIGPLLEAAGVSSVHDGPEGRVWRFRSDATSEVVEHAPDALIRGIRAADPDDDEQVYEVQVAVADTLVALEQALPGVHEHLILASLARLVNDAGLRRGKLRTSEGGGLVMEFSVKSDLERHWATGPGSPTE